MCALCSCLGLASENQQTAHIANEKELTVDEVFEGKYHRRVFFAAVALLFATLVAVRYLVTPAPGAEPTLALVRSIAILDNVTSGFFASLLVGATIYFFRRRRVDPGLITQLDSRDIVPAFDVALREATGWIFCGNRGRYLRSKVLPTLAKKQGTFSIDAIITNPTNVAACAKFAEHKSVRIAQDEPGIWDTERVQADILAAIVVCAWFTRYPALSIKLYLRESFSPIRLDSNLKMSFLTVENKRESCLRFRSGHFFHEWLLDDYAVGKLQAKLISLPTINRTALTEVSEADIELVASAVGFVNIQDSLVHLTKNIVALNADPFR